MKTLKGFPDLDKALSAVLISCLLVALVTEQWVKSCGFLMTPDSCQYVSAARSFREAGVLLNADGSSYVSWPPLFPFILSLFVESSAGMTWLNVLCKVIVGAGVFYIGRTFLSGKIFVLFYCVSVLLSVYLLMISVFLWSELVFLTLLLVNISLALNLRKHPTIFYLLMVSGFLLCLQRNAGFFWVAGTSIWFLSDKTISFRHRLRQSFTYFIFSSSGNMTWNFYNTFFSGKESIFAAPDYFTEVSTNIHAMLLELGVSLFPFRGIYADIAGGILVVALVVFLVKVYPLNQGLRLLILGLLGYVAGFISISYLATETNRYYAVVFPIVILLLFVFLERLTQRFPGKRWVVIIFIALWMIYPIARTAKNAMLWHDRSCAAVSDK